MRPKNSLLRPKCNSLPAFRTRIYSKLRHNPSHEQWRLFLHQQLQLEPTIKQLSRADFDVSSQNQQKVSVRQNFKLKKQIVLQLQNNNIPSALLKLQELRGKLAVFNQQGNVLQMIMYLECRRTIQQGLTTGHEERIIEFIKDRVAPFVCENMTLLAKIRTMTLLSILLLRFHGILMTGDERVLLIRTIELKKKKMLQMDSKTQRQEEFQCLIYLLLQLYKILYLLKVDQQTIQQYYSQLCAYYQLYETKHHKKHLDSKQVKKVLENMKPILNDLQIYEDSKLRSKLASQHIKQQIIEKQEQKYCRRSIKQANNEGDSFTFDKLGSKIISKKRILRLTSINDNSENMMTFKKQSRRLTKYPTNIAIETQNQPQAVNQLTKKGIYLSFLLPLKQKIFIIDFTLSFRDGFGLIDLSLFIKSESYLEQKFRMKGIRNVSERVNLATLDRLIEKIVLRLFGQYGQFREIHNLIVDQDQVPSQYQGIQTGLMRVKAVLKDYIRRHYQQQYLIGKKIIYPKITSQQLNTKLLKEAKQADYKGDRANFNKRIAMIHKDSPAPVIDDTVFVKCLLKHDLPNLEVAFFLFNAYYKNFFKGLDVHHFKNYQDEFPDASPFISRLKKIAKQAHEEHKLVRKERVVSQMLELQHREERLNFKVKQYKIQEELQLSKRIFPSNIPMKMYNPLKRCQKHKERIILQVIKTKRDKYEIFSKQLQGKYVTYRNDRSIIYVPYEQDGCGSLKFQRKRVRMYNSIKLICMKGDGLKNFKTTKQNNSIVTAQQDIVLVFSRHIIVRRTRGYILVIEYKSPKGQFLYEIIVSPSKRFFSLRKEALKIINQDDVNLQGKRLYDSSLQFYEEGRKPISEANHYYLSSFN